MGEGYIKFNCLLSEYTSGLSDENYYLLNKWREKLYRLRLIGCYPGDIGYGNISIRSGAGFIITGSATGCRESLMKEDYVMVDHYDFLNNEIHCCGKIMASAESLTHAAVYEARPETMAVIHIHNADLWERYKGVMPTSSYEAEYGTPEIAMAVKSLCLNDGISGNEIIIMGGHKDGIIAFGNDLDQAGNKILGMYGFRGCAYEPV
jgi:ribulose-5-phosphate 4-epimerase/fuculose-1-phosphate aldolase